MIQVSFNGAKRSSVRKYKTKTRAMSSIRIWFQNNVGHVVFYQPELPPTYYHSLDELPAIHVRQPKDFYKSAKWLKLRAEVLLESDRHCAWCGRGVEHGTQLEVDHIKPRSKFPHLELVKSNLQVLCKDCNLGKSDLFEENLNEAPAQRL